MPSASRHDLVPALIVPDEQTWTMLGHDPADNGAEPSFSSVRTAAVLVPDRIPEQLAGPLAGHLAELSGDEWVDRRELALPGSFDTAGLLDRWDLSAPAAGARMDREGDGGPGHHETHDHDHGDAHAHAHAQEDADGEGHEHHDHGDMMAIVGEPSADGLVMEPIELRYGPLAVPFPGGLTIDATLDGEVVCEASVSGLEAHAASPYAPPSAPDPLAPAAWGNAIARAHGEDGARGRTAVFAVELERAISHLAWLRALSRLLGWARMTDRTASALAELTAIDPGVAGRGEIPEDAGARLGAAAAAISRVLAVLSGSRTLRWRLAGHGVVPPERAEELDLHGPNARASGLPRDARRNDPLYAELGFAPLLERAGDAAARTLLRAREAAQAVELARSALAAECDDGASDAIAADGTVEGPRGAIQAGRREGGWRFEAPGAAAARALAGEAMIGEAWGDALAVLASFDLSPWEPAP